MYYVRSYLVINCALRQNCDKITDNWQLPLVRDRCFQDFDSERSVAIRQRPWLLPPCLSLSWGLSLLLWKGLEFSLQAWSDGSWICPLLGILCWHLGKDAFKVRALWFAVWEEELLPVTLECSGWLVGDCLQTTCFSGKFRQQLCAGHSQSFMPATHSSPTEGDQSRPQTEAVCGSSDFLQ